MCCRTAAESEQKAQLCTIGDSAWLCGADKRRLVVVVSFGMRMRELFSFASVAGDGLCEMARLDTLCVTGLEQAISVKIDARTFFFLKCV
jgi:hypothetical protein